MTKCASTLSYRRNSLIVNLQMLKSMLHALLIPGTLSFLSVASNRRLKSPAYRVIGAYVSEVSSSHTNFVEHDHDNPVTGHNSPIS